MLFPVMALAVLAGGLLTVTNASADDSLNTHDTIVQKIADKFGLNKDEVQKVFDEERTARQAEMQTKNAERLDQLVKDGRITEAQKTLILNKQKELQAKHQANRDSFKDKAPGEMKTQMEAERTALEAWAKENGINIEYLHGGGKFMIKSGGPHGSR
ncbi:MAG: hypothetical protein ACD_37C00459G0003 [uncultured bacterium]|nr:MAG: hypothetical protein ACD_37C00459G0003 [uncultured bacterium]